MTVFYIVNGRRVDPFGRPLDDDVPEPTTLSVPGLNDEQNAALAGAGYDTPASLRAASDNDLIDVALIGPAAVRRIRQWLAESE